ncbi:WD40 repeat-like protein [Lichtheimia hyalospora FSU 10163]|nr:WD40 repeat-like protein [Lichtheimia hyalospora FSU 10163]
MISEPNKPAPLQFDKTIFHFTLHPEQNLVATGLINGKVYCHRYGIDQHEEQWMVKPFKKSCRGVEFSPDGKGIHSISKDKTICLLDTETGKTIRSKESAHEVPLNALLCLNENILATGDDDGVIKVVLNAMIRGDGYLSTWDIRKPDVAAMSDNMEDELLSVKLLKNGEKAVVGSQEGILSLWSWDYWGDYNDRIVGHPSSIDTICKLDEDTICTGSSDGIIR